MSTPDAPPPSSPEAAPTPPEPADPPRSRLRQVGWHLAIELLLPALGYLAMAVLVGWPVLIFLQRTLVGAGPIEGPSDRNAGIWIYWWMHEAVTTGRSLFWVDVSCAPDGLPLGGAYPNRLDAWFAMPFYHLFPFPSSHNLFELSLPAMGALASYFCLRAVSSSRLLAWCGGLLVGFNAYTFFELREGRPVTALIFLLPLFVGCWLRALSRPAGAALFYTVGSGIVGALVFMHYLPFALYLGFFAALAAVARMLLPAPGTWRVRVPGVVLLAALTAGVASASYLHELVVIRHLGPGEHVKIWSAVREPMPPWDPRLWQEMRRFLEQSAKKKRGSPMDGNLARQLEEVRQVQRHSLSLDYLWSSTTWGRRDRAWITPAAVLLAVGLAPLARARGLGFLALTAFYWLLTLGPRPCRIPGYAVENSALECHKLLLPTFHLLEAIPEAIYFLKPYRAFPLMLLFMAATIVVGLEAAARRPLPARLEATLERLRTRRLPEALEAFYARLIELEARIARRLRLETRIKRPLRLAGVILPLLTLIYVWDFSGRRLFWTLWKPSPFYQRLASLPGEFSIIELPLGIGHGNATAQVMHGRPRADSHHDLIDSLQQGRPPPLECMRRRYLQGLWDLGRVTSRAPFVPAPTRTDFEQARQDGFRYVIVNRTAYTYLERFRGMSFDLEDLLDQLMEPLGDPVYEDDELIVFEIRAGDQGG